MRGYRVTMRRGPRVNRERYDEIDDALAAAERQVADVRREGNLPSVTMLRDFTPEQRVHARIEISGPGLFRGREAGIDVMGDGAIVPYAGAIRKRVIEPEGGETAYEAIGRALKGG